MTREDQPKTAVVLFNLGGPDSLRAVRPFLYNLFKDRAIIDLPSPVRQIVAALLSWKRSPQAKKIYRRIGGRSPIVEETAKQAEALEYRLSQKGNFRVFHAMRYWHPFASEVAASVKEFNPEKIILLPLYPQFSSTTTASSIENWQGAAKAAGVSVPTSTVCCFPTENHFIAAHVKQIMEAYWAASEYGKPRVLFSAHGLPEKIIKKGDPYQWQVEQTVAAIMRVLAIEGLEYSICYQSRVGPLKWIGPSTESEIVRAARDGMPIVISPIAFVSEHSETLVELDIEYANLAKRHGVSAYIRVPALGIEELFIESLAQLCYSALDRVGIGSQETARLCPSSFRLCACQAAAKTAAPEETADAPELLSVA